MTTVIRIAGLPGLVIIGILIVMRLIYGPRNYITMFLREHKRAQVFVLIMIAIGFIDLITIMLAE